MGRGRRPRPGPQGHWARTPARPAAAGPAPAGGRVWHWRRYKDGSSGGAASFREVHKSHIFSAEIGILTAILILFMFLLIISIRFRYLNHLVANRMAPSMCPEHCETRWPWRSGFNQFCTTFPPHIWCSHSPHNFLKCRIKLTDMPNLSTEGYDIRHPIQIRTNECIPSGLANHKNCTTSCYSRLLARGCIVAVP